LRIGWLALVSAFGAHSGAAAEPKPAELRVATFDMAAGPLVKGPLAYDPTTNKSDLGLRGAASRCWEAANRSCIARSIGSASPSKATTHESFTPEAMGWKVAPVAIPPLNLLSAKTLKRGDRGPRTQPGDTGWPSSG